MKIKTGYEIISVSWKNTDNWMNHELFSELSREAVSNKSTTVVHTINIERNAFDIIISKFLEKILVEYEKTCRERGENLRADLQEELEAVLREEIPQHMPEAGSL